MRGPSLGWFNVEVTGDGKGRMLLLVLLLVSFVWFAR
jgi:hypothetical protein